MGYGNHALTRRIVDRIFDSKPRPYVVVVVVVVVVELPYLN